MSLDRTKTTADGEPPLIFLPESGLNFPIIPFQLPLEEDYIKYKRECEAKLARIYDENPNIRLAHEVALGILRANIAKRVQHAKKLPDSTIPEELLPTYPFLLDHVSDLRASLDPTDTLAPYLNRLLLFKLDSVEVGFRFVGASQTTDSAFDDRQLGLNSYLAHEYLGRRFPVYLVGGSYGYKISRIIGHAGHNLAVIKTKLDGARLVSADGRTELASRGRRTGVVDLNVVGDDDAKEAFRVLAGAGSDESMADYDREHWKGKVRAHLLGRRAAYQPVFERYYFAREDVSVEPDR